MEKKRISTIQSHQTYSHTNTPEHRLWFWVLYTWIQDVTNTNSYVKLTSLRDQVRLGHTRLICELVGLSYQRFIDCIDKICEKKLAEGNLSKPRRLRFLRKNATQDNIEAAFTFEENKLIFK